jgi:hypothetical protein
MLSKGCGYGLQRCGKGTLCGLSFERKRERRNSPKLYRSRENSQKLCHSRMRQQTHKKVCCGRTRTVSDTGAKLQQVAAKVGRAYSSSLGKRAGRFAEQQPTLGVRQKKHNVWSIAFQAYAPHQTKPKVSLIASVVLLGSTGAIQPGRCARPGLVKHQRSNKETWMRWTPGERSNPIEA